MQVMVFALSFIIAARISYGDSSLRNSASARETPEEIAAWNQREAARPINDLPRVLLDTAYGSITLGNVRQVNSPFIYVWKNVAINPKSIPNLNLLTNLRSTFPESAPYREWADIKFTYIDPPPFQYLADDKTNGFMKGYIVRRLFFRAGNGVYKKPDIPKGAEVFSVADLNVIPLVSY